MTFPKHIAILGAGPGGYVAAIRAAQLGARVTVVEQEALGGVCLNWGCIPSKALLSVVELGDKLKKAAEMGLTGIGTVGYDPAKMVARKDAVVASLRRGVATLFKSWDITHLEGRGELLNPKTLRVSTAGGVRQDVQADAIVVATGSSWPNLPQFPIDGRQVITSREALEFQLVPASLLIIGGGVEGCEFASLYSGLGTKVTVVELLPRLLPTEDEEISAIVTRELKKRGVEVCAGTSVDRWEKSADSLTVMLKDGAKLDVRQILVSVGRGFNSRGIGLESAGVTLGRRGEILVDEHLQTNVPGVYAIGDVTGKAMLAHVASAQGKVAVSHALGHSARINYDVIPAGIFTLPEVGRVGLTEAQARARCAEQEGDPARDVKVGRFRYVALGKSQATGDTTGLFKLIAEARNGRLLGAHIVGAHAADLIHEAALAMEAGIPAARVASMIHAHPTMAEGLMEAAEDLTGEAIHLARSRT
jgi:dihydrolipoamide dehydrogenase